MDYRESGVNIELGDVASQVLYEAAKATWENRKGKLGELIVPFDDFTGVRAIDVSNLPRGTLMNIGFDGVGTKMELAERIGNHRTIGHDLFAMLCDDVIVRGAEPVLIGSILDVNTLGTEEKPHTDKVKQLAEGYINGARAANVAIVNGEIAELGGRVGGYGPFNYNWGGAVVWFANKERLFTGNEIKPGDSLVGLREDGFRSNGLSLVRKIMQDRYEDNWHKVHCHDASCTFGEAILTPSKIYTAAVVDMFGGYDLDREPRAEVHGVAHITGGGIPGKLGRILKPSGLGAKIDYPFEAISFMKIIQKIGEVPDREAYKTWNMRHGAIIVTPEPEKVIQVASEYEIEGRRIGHVTEESGIRIYSRGAYQKEKVLTF